MPAANFKNLVIAEKRKLTKLMSINATRMLQDPIYFRENLDWQYTQKEIELILDKTRQKS